jgi:hypothetical protein
MGQDQPQRGQCERLKVGVDAGGCHSRTWRDHKVRVGVYMRYRSFEWRAIAGVRVGGYLLMM